MSPKKSTIEQIPLASLVEDMDLYPRHAVDGAHVSSLVQALESGAVLPPLVADKKSKRITDGWHRARAYRRFVGEDAVIDVELVEYSTEAEMMFDAVHRNSKHGRRLDAMDLTRSAVMLEKQGLGKDKIAMALNVTEGRVEKLVLKVATTRAANANNVPGTHKIALKRPVRHFAGGTMTKEQVEAHKMMPGTSFLLIAKQLTEAIRTKLIDLDDEKLVEQLGKLRDALASVV